MKLVGTVLHAGSAFAVYSSDPTMTAARLRALVAELGMEQPVVFGPDLRLVAVDDEPAPGVLPPDISESIHDRPTEE